MSSETPFQGCVLGELRVGTALWSWLAPSPPPHPRRCSAGNPTLFFGMLSPALSQQVQDPSDSRKLKASPVGLLEVGGLWVHTLPPHQAPPSSLYRQNQWVLSLNKHTSNPWQFRQ